jgi:hypothetical protein
MNAHSFAGCCAVVLVSVTGCASVQDKHYIEHQQQPVNESIERVALVVVNNGEPRFLGELESSGPNQNPSGMMYGPGATGFAVTLAAHAIAQSAVDDGKASAEQEEANLVLAKYHNILAQYSDRYITEVSLAALGATIRDAEVYDLETHPQNSGFIIEMNPVFYMAKNEQSLVLKNAITIRRDLHEDRVVYQNMIQTIATTESPQPSDHWLTQEGEMLSKTIANALAESIEAAIEDAQGKFTDNRREETIAYTAGTVTRYERGTILVDDCVRRVLRTLRGWIFVLPTQSHCASNSQSLQ